MALNTLAYYQTQLVACEAELVKIIAQMETAGDAIRSSLEQKQKRMMDQSAYWRQRIAESSASSTLYVAGVDLEP